jgi:hypothetical protein
MELRVEPARINLRRRPHATSHYLALLSAVRSRILSRILSRLVAMCWNAAHIRRHS